MTPLKIELIIRSVVALCCGFACCGTLGAASADAPRYNRDIRPILSDRCFACHGPDAGTRKAELRLDTEAGAHELAITAGDSEGSELLIRISSDDPDVKM